MDYKREYLKMKKKYIDLKKQYTSMQTGGNNDFENSYLNYGPLNSIVESDAEIQNDIKNLNLNKNTIKNNDIIERKNKLTNSLKNINLNTESEQINF